MLLMIRALHVQSSPTDNYLLSSYLCSLALDHGKHKKYYQYCSPLNLSITHIYDIDWDYVRLNMGDTVDPMTIVVILVACRCHQFDTPKRLCTACVT